MGVQIPLLPSPPLYLEIRRLAAGEAARTDSGARSLPSRHPSRDGGPAWGERDGGDGTIPAPWESGTEASIARAGSGSRVLEYVGIRVRDLERSRKFYSEGLGLVAGRTGRMAAGGIWLEMTDPDSHVTLELNYYPDQPPYREGDELDHLGFRVRRIAATMTKLVGLGARLRIPAFREGDVQLAFLSDPDGVWIELQEEVGPDQPPTSQVAT